MNFRDQYQQKLCSPEEAVRLVGNGNRIRGCLNQGPECKTAGQNLIAIAHPDHRDWPTFEAKKLGLI